MGDQKRFQEYLVSLPPELRAKIMAERTDEQSKQKLDGFDNAIAVACDAALSVAVVAHAEAKNDREREDAVRCTAIVITTLQQIRTVLTHVLPPGPKAQILGVVTAGCAQGVGQYDQIVRKILPIGTNRRARILELGYEAVEAEDKLSADEAARQGGVIMAGAAEHARQEIGMPASQTEGVIVPAPIAAIVDISGAPLSTEPTEGGARE